MAKFHWDEYIEERKDVMLDKPVFKGTRLTVELVLKALGAGKTQEGEEKGSGVLISNMNDPEQAITMENLPIVGMAMGFVLLLDLGAIFGLILIVVGLVSALKKQSVKPS